MAETDPFDLQRFIDAQAQTYEDALAELSAGRKRTHWMWYVFPQLKGLGSSPMARHYAIGSLAEAKAYLAHPLLGARLAACTEAMNRAPPGSARDILGVVDDLKFRSSMTLFAMAAPEAPAFRAALDRHYGGQADPHTLALLEG